MILDTKFKKNEKKTSKLIIEFKNKFENKQQINLELNKSK